MGFGVVACLTGIGRNRSKAGHVVVGTEVFHATHEYMLKASY